ncbi:MAG: hypothetical protein KatS3mg076_1147 [Candidatus Binatia bacterium]|nr:MAG: hypothetical protein KatS3mg076_1147 [Candidatus Binatia bacterium]
MRLVVATSSYPLHPDDAFAAAGLFVRDFALELHHLGHEVLVFTHRRRGHVEDDPGIEVLRHPGPSLDRALGSLRWHRPADAFLALRLLSSGWRALRVEAERRRIDHLLAMWAFPAGFYGLLLKRKFGIPYSVWTLGSDVWSLGKQPGFGLLLRRILREAEHRFSDGLALSRATERLSGLPCAFLPSARRAVPDEPDRPRTPGARFVFLGRFEPAKGPDILLRAAAILDRRGARFQLSLYGLGSLESTLRRTIRSERLEARVTLEGPADPTRTLEIFRGADFVVVPSRAESIPVVFSDALHARTPVVTSDVGDLGELVRAHRLGVVVRPCDPAALADGMAEALRGPRDEWSRNAARLAALFSPERSARSFLERLSAPLQLAERAA